MSRVAFVSPRFGRPAFPFFRVIACGTKACAVFGAGFTTRGVWPDVIVVSDRRVAPRGAAGAISEVDEASQRGGKTSRRGLHCRQRSGFRMGIEAT